MVEAVEELLLEPSRKMKRKQNSSKFTTRLGLTMTIQRQNYYWSDMAKDVAHVQQNCSKCQEVVDVTEALYIQEAEDWRLPYLNYL